MKTYMCKVNWLYGCEFFDIVVKANSERKARIITKNKVIKERGNGSFEICSCEKITNINKE